MLFQFKFFALLVACSIIFLLPQPLYAATPEVHASQVRDFYRITFEWPRPTYLTADINGNTLIIRFERQANPDMTAAMGALKKVAKSYLLGPDGKTLRVTLNGNYRARAFVSGSVSGVDIIPSGADQSPAKVIQSRPISIAEAPSPTEAVKLSESAPTAQTVEPEPAEAAATPAIIMPAPKTVPKAAAKPVAAPKVAVTQPKPPAEKTQVQKPVVPPQQPVETASTASETEAPPASEPEAKPADKAPIAEPVQEAPTQAAQINEAEEPEATEETEETNAEEALAEDEAQVQAEAEDPTQTPAELDEEAVVVDDEIEYSDESEASDEPEEGDSKILKVRARLEGEELQIQFPWQQRTAAAAYVRNDMAWIVFDNVTTLDLSKVSGMLRAGVNIKQVPIDNATILYLPISNGAGISIRSIENTFRWEVAITAGQRFSEHPAKVQLSTDPPLKPHVLLDFLDAAEVIRFKDPVIGDQLDILPTYTSGKGVTPQRNFPEFSLMDTLQGLVVLRKSNDTTVEIVRNGVRVSTHQGATISPQLPLPEEVKHESSAENTDVFFPFNEWRVEDNKNHTVEIELIKRKIARTLASNEAEYYRRIAELHLAYGEAVEALGYLQNIKRIDPEFYIRNRLSAMQGAANFLLHRYADAARNFRVSELRNLKEAKFWQVMLEELLGKPTKQFDYDANYEPYIKYYPPILKQRIGVFAADRYIANRDYNAALKIFDQLNEHKLINEVADYINYLMGKIALETQQPEDGYKLWKEILEGKASEFVKVRAEFALVIEKMRRKEMTTAEATDRLEQLAMRWRGDNLELAVLSSLSEIYESNKDWANSIRIWQVMNEAFPNTLEAVEASRKMDDAFVAIFDRGERGQLSDLDLMFLYHQYRDLIPEDDTGDRIIEKIAELMIKMDMLGPAADLLEDRMRYRFEHVERSTVGAKLAEVLLLDQKPKEALEALRLSVFGVLPEALHTKRNALAAQALLDLKQHDDLFLLLKQDSSPQADYYRMQAHWSAKNWKELASIGEKILKNRSAPTAPLTRIEQDALVKLALAYVALDEAEQTAYLRDYFMPLMKDKPQAQVFSYLTQPYLKLTPENFDEVIQLLDKTKSFLATDIGAAPSNGAASENTDG